MPYSEELPTIPRRNRWVAPFLTIVSLGGAGGAGYIAYKTRLSARELRRDNQSLSSEAAQHRASAAQTKQQLESCQQTLETEVAARKEADGTLAVAQTDLAACRENVTDLNQQKAEAAARLAEFQSLTQKFRRMIDTGKLEVMFRRGKMVVKLPDAVLFPSGSAELTASGRSALAEVAGILKHMRDRRFTVGGHTDNVPVSNEAFKSNWELSTARAVKVLEMLVQKGVRPQNLVAAGWGEYDPVASNRRAAGRQRNRRIEIILEPALQKVLVEEKKAKKGQR